MIKNLKQNKVLVSMDNIIDKITTEVQIEALASTYNLFEKTPKQNVYLELKNDETMTKFLNKFKSTPILNSVDENGGV